MTSVALSERSPYKGLSPFSDSDEDAALFFGRGREVEIVVANALASRLTVLYGPSGCGKSSLLRAGAVHSLRGLGANEPVAVAYYSTWAGDPVRGIDEAARGSLAAAFGGDPGEAAGGLVDRLDAWTAALGCTLCLILDQFEELFVYQENALLDELPELVTRQGLRVNVMLGIRDDELAKLDIFKASVPGLFSNYLRLDLLGRREAEAAITGPLDRLRERGQTISIEDDLVESVLNEVAAGRIDTGLAGRGIRVEPAGEEERIETPYLQLVMQRLWEVEAERRSTTLRRSTLSELGGAQQIVEDHLQRALAALTPAQRDVAAGMFDYLVTPSGAKIAHGVADLASFAHVETAEIQPVLDSLARERILRHTHETGQSGGRYEIYHDVLAGAVLTWRTGHEAHAAADRDRLAASRRQRRLAAVAIVALVAFAVMAALAIYAQLQANHARASTLLQKAGAELSVDPGASIRDALASADRHRSGRTEQVLRTALLATNALTDIRPGGQPSYAAYSPDGSRIALADRAGDVGVFAVPSGKRITTFHAGSPVNWVAWAPDGSHVAAAARDGDTRVWKLAAPGRPSLVLPQGAPARSVAYSPDGSRILTGGGPAARIWNARTGHLLHRLPTTLGLTAYFSRDGRLALPLERARSVRVWDALTGRRLSTLSHDAEITSAAFGPADMVVTGSRDGTGAIWNARTGRRRARLTGHTGQVSAVAINPLGDAVATASLDGTARVWTASGDLTDVVRGASTSVVSVAFAPDGSTLVSASSDGTARTTGTTHYEQILLGQRGPLRQAVFSPHGTTVATIGAHTLRLWEPYGEAQLRPLNASAAPATAVAFDPTGRLVATTDRAGSLMVQGAPTGATTTLRLGSRANAVVWAPDGRLVVAGANGVVHVLPRGRRREARTFATGAASIAAAIRPDGDAVATVDALGTVRIWNTTRGALLRKLDVDPRVTAIALDPTGKLVAVGVANDVRVYSATNGELKRTLRGHRNDVTGVAFSPDGRQLASSSLDHDARLYDTKTLTTLKVLHRHFSFVSGVAFSADGRWVATAGPLKAGLWATHASDLRDSFLYFVSGNTAPIAAVAFSPRGWKVATAAGDGSIRLFDCKLCAGLDGLRSYGKERLSRLGG